MNLLILLTPLITALIGWLTNWVAIKMLFRPKHPFSFLGFRIQGLIPKRQSDLAIQCADIIEKELLHQHMIADAIESIDIEPVIKESMGRLIDDKLAGKLKEIPMLGAMINESTIEPIKKVAIEEMLLESKWMLHKFSEDVEQKFDIKAIVQQKIEEFDLDKLESIVTGVSKKEFKMIEWIGAVLGFLIGLVQILVFKCL